MNAKNVNLSYRGQVFALLKHSLKIAKGLAEDKQKVILDTIEQRFYRHRGLPSGSRAAAEALREGWEDIESLSLLRKRKLHEESQNKEYLVTQSTVLKKATVPMNSPKLAIRLRIPVHKRDEKDAKRIDFVYLATLLAPFGTVTRYERESDDVISVSFSNETEKQAFLSGFPTVLPG